MIAWLNGTFGVGKTTTASLIERRSDTWRAFDPEWVGHMLRANLAGREIGDFQHLAAWRRLVPSVAREVADFSGQRLVAVQTVLVKEYWHELRSGLIQHGFEVMHVFLDADEEVLRQRIADDDAMRHAIAEGTVEPGAHRWRLDHLADYRVARSWMAAEADVVVDTTAVDPDEVASRVLDAIGAATFGRS